MRSTGMSPVVEAWSTCRTSSAQDWPPDRLLQAKGQTTVSVVMPARDEEATVGTIAAAIRSALIQAVPLVDEIIVVDSRSADGTAAAARAPACWWCPRTTSPVACRRCTARATRCGPGWPRPPATSLRHRCRRRARSIRASLPACWGPW